MPRSSGQKAMPPRAIALDGSPISSRPSKRTEPVRWPTIPMIDLSVVVLPAPLRPSSVTTSPGSTSKVAPCKTCDSPYQACNSSTARRGATVGLSMTDSEIGLAHGRIGRDGLVVPLCQHAPAGEDRDPMREVRDDAQVMLHHQHRAARRDRL